MPFDTGAFHNNRLHPPFHKAMEKVAFGLDVAKDAPGRLINLFYGSDKDYYNSRPKGMLGIPHDEYDDLEIDSYFRLLHHRSDSESDDRVQR